MERNDRFQRNIKKIGLGFIVAEVSLLIIGIATNSIFCIAFSSVFIFTTIIIIIATIMGVKAIKKTNPDTTSSETSTHKEPDFTYYKLILDYGEQFFSFYKELSNNFEFKEQLRNSTPLSVLQGAIYQTSDDDKIQMLLAADLYKIYANLRHSHIDFNRKESLGLVYVLSRISGKENITCETLPTIYKELYKSINDYLPLVKEINQNHPDILFLLGTLIGYTDKNLQKRYYILLYRYASVIAKTDGYITDQEAEFLKNIMEIDSPQDNHQLVSNDAEKQEDALKQLDTLVGLNNVKKEVITLCNFIKIQKIRSEQNIKTPSISFHCVFTGNPGTGKTTVARILAGVYKNMGILQKGQLVETDRSGLVAEYIGQTAVKTNTIIDSALGGVLFIDEAYSLISEGQDDFGKEAIATLLKRMEDDRDQLVVILAGYTNEMKKFIDSNPGLQSRFNRYIEFEDYSEEELLQIYQANLNKYDYNISETAIIKLKATIHHAIANKDNNFGNGRWVRNLFEKNLGKQANRIATINDISHEILNTITEQDI